MAPDSFLVACRERQALLNAFPALDPTMVIDGWHGTLANAGETVRIERANGSVADAVRYADAGDWASRRRGPLDFGHRGWEWQSGADGGGASLELRSPLVDNASGQTWGSSLVEGGTPGEPNSIAGTSIPPLLLDLSHDPPIPSSEDPVTVSIRVSPTPGQGVDSVTLFHRDDGDPGFGQTAMVDAIPGLFQATLPPQPDGSVVEFYVRCAAGDGAVRTWPGPTAEDGSQEANALYIVDDSFEPDRPSQPGDEPVFRIVLTEVERAELERIGSRRGESESNAEMNATVIRSHGLDIDVRYRCSIRNRGASSRFPPPNNHLVKFPSDALWRGRASLKFNAKNPASQVAGSILFRHLGVETANAMPARLLINGANLLDAAPFPAYAMVESFDSDYAETHWPDDPGGNLYQVRDDEQTGEQGELQYEGADAPPTRTPISNRPTAPPTTGAT